MLTSSGPPPPSQYGYTPLHEAARNGHIKIVEYLIENGVAVDVRSSVSPQPTFPRRRRAAVSSRRACSDALSFRHLTGPLRRSHRVQMGLTPLHRAALFGRLGMVDLLLKLGAQIDAQDNVRPPFHPCVCVCGCGAVSCTDGRSLGGTACLCAVWLHADGQSQGGERKVHDYTFAAAGGDRVESNDETH